QDNLQIIFLTYLIVLFSFQGSNRCAFVSATALLLYQVVIVMSTTFYIIFCRICQKRPYQYNMLLSDSQQYFFAFQIILLLSFLATSNNIPSTTNHRQHFF
ncbi:hypothetical protein, partial [Radiobacillus sp. PE A8.2]|uniref:hypothetical protein n=1 Tax=Radiobacillus sp. PE A8.2 TaxID=3380349 RepID=UPI00388D8E08